MIGGAVLPATPGLGDGGSAPKLCCGHIPRVVRNRRGKEIKLMPKIVKVIEILSESPKSWEEAAQNVVAEASKTLRNIRMNMGDRF